MSLGSGFSFQGVDGHACGGSQFSTVDVNAQRLTSCAGNYDDGFGGNGGLITVGGVGDSTDNPADPNAESGDDDELYNLVPLLHQGDQQLKIDTANPSSDDNLFLAVVDITARARATTIDCSDPANASKIDCQAPPPPPGPSSGSSGSSGSSTSSSGTSTQSTATAAPPPAGVAVSCTDNRRFTFKLHHAPGQRVVQVDIAANGKRVKTVKGRNLMMVTIDTLPQETFTVKITAVQKSGEQAGEHADLTGAARRASRRPAPSTTGAGAARASSHGVSSRRRPTGRRRGPARTLSTPEAQRRAQHEPGDDQRRDRHDADLPREDGDHHAALLVGGQPPHRLGVLEVARVEHGLGGRDAQLLGDERHRQRQQRVDPVEAVVRFLTGEEPHAGDGQVGQVQRLRAAQQAPEDPARAARPPQPPAQRGDDREGGRDDDAEDGVEAGQSRGLCDQVATPHKPVIEPHVECWIRICPRCSS